MVGKPERKAINVKGIDPQLYRLAKADAAKKGIPIGAWFNQAIKEKLEGR